MNSNELYTPFWCTVLVNWSYMEDMQMEDMFDSISTDTWYFKTVSVQSNSGGELVPPCM